MKLHFHEANALSSLVPDLADERGDLCIGNEPAAAAQAGAQPTALRHQGKIALSNQDANKTDTPV